MSSTSPSLSAEVVEGCVHAFLQRSFDNPAPTPEFHRELWNMCCSDYKFVAVAAPRGFAKSTAVTHCYTIANIVFRERAFILVVADTEGQATFFVEDIKKELTENEDMMKMFGIKGLVKDAATDFIIEFEDGHQARVIAKGSGQSLRGVKWDSKRPDLIVCDDLENEELVLNKDRRAAFRKWFAGTLIPCRAKHGIIRVVGTILHTDSQLNRFMPRLGKRDQPCYVDDLKEVANAKAIWHSARYRAHDKLLTKSLWPEHKPVEWLRQERQTFVDAGLSDLWAQEMLNVPFDESTAPFKRKDFTEIAKGELDGITLNYYISTDFATQEKQKSDYSAFIVAGMDSNGTIYIVKVIQQRMESPEILETLFLLNKQYDPMSIFVESGQIWGTLKPLVLNEMSRTGQFFTVEDLPSITDKRSRSSAIRARMRVGAVKFDQQSDWWPDFLEECLRFPQGHDDQVDALSLLGLALNKFTEAPTPEEQAEEVYQDELETAGFFHGGRNEHTGY